MTARTIAAISVCFFCAVTAAHAQVPYAGWGSGASTQLDATGENGISSGTALYTGQDIVSTSYKKDGTVHYFRLDILGEPEALTTGNYFSGIYGIAIDSEPGGADGSTSSTFYDPPTVTGIDYLLDSHWELAALDSTVLTYVKTDFHEWGGSSYSINDLTAQASGDHDHSMGSSYYQLEWSIDESIIGSTVDNWYGYTLDGGSTPGYYDLVPEPTTLAVLGIGGVFALVRKRR